MESRAMLPTRKADSWEGAEQSEARVDVQVPIQSGDGSIPSERNIWRHFESYKRSAILHTAQYLQHSAAMYSEESAIVDFDSLERGEQILVSVDILLTVVQWPEMVGRSPSLSGT